MAAAVDQSSFTGHDYAGGSRNIVDSWRTDDDHVTPKRKRLA